MKIRTLWEHDGNPNHMPWMVAAVDEYTEEEHNGTPEFYQMELDKHSSKRRELIINIPDAAVVKLFESPEVPGKVGP